jgi:serine phosphatase RsbU (regulator of sigma subunit)
MPASFTIRNFHQWADIIYDPDKEFISRMLADRKGFRKLIIEDVAESLYEDMRRCRMLITSPFTPGKSFSTLDREEKKTWFGYASGIPAKLQSLGLMIKPGGEFYRTCIITDEEIEKLALMDHEQLPGNSGISWARLPEARKWYFRELNYLIPRQLKKAGFEIIRSGEEELINPVIIKKLARAIHARYIREMRNRDNQTSPDYPGDKGGQYLLDFDDLPNEIKYSNVDSAYHITTKLLSIGYRIKPAAEGHKPVALHLDDDQVEIMAKTEHIRWSWDKRLNGWIYGNARNNEKKIHPGLISYEHLSDSEKEKDREIVRLIPAILQDIGYVAYPALPGTLKNISYAIKPKSSIQKLLTETHRMNEEIRIMASANPEMEEKVRTIGKKIEETIREVEGSYNYARNIQETFLPDDLFIRECFPESFVLFRPKDIVSGDFYFFSKQNSRIVFAAADCTGHGIPGALLSMLGYGIIDQAVNEIRLARPSDILGHLYSRIHKYLRRKDDLIYLPDDMDITVCMLDTDAMILTYAGVTVPFYLIINGELVEMKAANFPEDSSGKEVQSFVSDSIKVKKGDMLYLFSDGFTDQFGGKSHKKYSRNRFKSFLHSIKDYDMPEQKDLLHQEFEKWREEKDEDQIDDVLVIGIRF